MERDAADCFGSDVILYALRQVVDFTFVLALNLIIAAQGREEQLEPNVLMMMMDANSA